MALLIKGHVTEIRSGINIIIIGSWTVYKLKKTKIKEMYHNTSYLLYKSMVQCQLGILCKVLISIHHKRYSRIRDVIEDSSFSMKNGCDI